VRVSKSAAFLIASLTVLPACGEPWDIRRSRERQEARAAEAAAYAQTPEGKAEALQKKEEADRKAAEIQKQQENVSNVVRNRILLPENTEYAPEGVYQLVVQGPQGYETCKVAVADISIRKVEIAVGTKKVVTSVSDCKPVKGPEPVPGPGR
jgi:hypothetical protein